MTDPENKRPSDFKPVDSPHERIKYLSEAAKSHAQTLIWTENQENTIQTKLTMFNQREEVLYTWIPDNFDPKKFQASLIEKNTKEVFFNVIHSTANLFFKTRFITQNSIGLQFANPDKLFRVQRRKDVRFQIPKGHLMRIAFADPRHPHTQNNWKVADISAGGLSFLAPLDDVAVYKIGLVIKDIQLVIHSKEIVFTGKVSHVKLVETFQEKNIRVGIAFTNLLPEHAMVLTQYIANESRKYFARFL